MTPREIIPGDAIVGADPDCVYCHGSGEVPVIEADAAGVEHVVADPCFCVLWSTGVEAEADRFERGRP